MARGQRFPQLKKGLAIVRRIQMHTAIERLHNAGVNNLSPTEAQAVVDVFIAVLQAAGASHLLQEIASDLEVRGLHIFAHAVRQHFRASRGKHEPPLAAT